MLWIVSDQGFFNGLTGLVEGADHICPQGYVCKVRCYVAMFNQAMEPAPVHNGLGFLCMGRGGTWNQKGMPLSWKPHPLS